LCKMDTGSYIAEDEAAEAWSWPLPPNTKAKNGWRYKSSTSYFFRSGA
jgi:hypothetical protein